MPNATIDPTQFERVELKSLEGAYICVRPLPYGMVLNRRDKATKMYMEANPGKSKRGAQDDANRFELETMNSWATAYDYAYCIGDHNLEDVNGNQLDLSSAKNVEMTLQILNPKIGAEIEKILSEINGSDEDEDVESFIKRHTSTSTEELTPLTST